MAVGHKLLFFAGLLVVLQQVLAAKDEKEASKTGIERFGSYFIYLEKTPGIYQCQDFYDVVKFVTFVKQNFTTACIRAFRLLSRVLTAYKLIRTLRGMLFPDRA